MFTSSTTVCPQLIKIMSDLQKELKGKGFDDVKLVSFSVDPEIDIPVIERLCSKIRCRLFLLDRLTGYSQEDIELFAKDNFKE